MLLLLGFAFISGLVTIFAPCIWPLLPIVLSSTIAGNSKSHKRPLGITLGIMMSFAFFTLSTAYIVSIFHIDPNILRVLAVIVIGFLGLMMIIPRLMVLFELTITRLSNKLNFSRNKQKDGFLGGFVAGLSLGIVWSPCAGPILASIAALAATGQVSFEVILVTIAYVIGVGIPLFAFAYGGQQFITRSKVISKYTGKIQRIFGVVMILMAILIYANYDKVLQVKLLDMFPQFGQTLNRFESNRSVTNELSKLKGKAPVINNLNQNSLFNENRPASEFVGVTKWLNSEQPLMLKDLKGKVVLVDFWTYTCINCIRTLPHVTSWYDKYNNPSLCSVELHFSVNENLPAGLKDKCFVVVGVHTPEFAFEKDTKNVLAAIKNFNIHYPIVQDNDYKIWDAYDNQYWPAEYLIDAQGKIRRVHFGEGEYEETEKAIQALLKESGQSVAVDLVNMGDETPTGNISPETYLGGKRLQFLTKIGTVDTGLANFKIDPDLATNRFSFGGTWNIAEEYATALGNAVIRYHFQAGKVFLVASPGTKSGNIKVLLDGAPISANLSGKDVLNGEVTIDSDRLYDLVNLGGKVENHLLELDFETPGTQVYAFTFGG